MDYDEPFGASKVSRNAAAVSMSCWVFGATFTMLWELGVRGGRVAAGGCHQEHDGARADPARPPTPDSKTQRLREKNKLAAAKCRSRQRSQVQTRPL